MLYTDVIGGKIITVSKMPSPISSPPQNSNGNNADASICNGATCNDDTCDDADASGVTCNDDTSYMYINNDSITDTLYDTDCNDNHVDNDCFAIDGSSAETEESTSTGICI